MGLENAEMLQNMFRTQLFRQVYFTNIVKITQGLGFMLYEGICGPLQNMKRSSQGQFCGERWPSKGLFCRTAHCLWLALRMC